RRGRPPQVHPRRVVPRSGPQGVHVTSVVSQQTQHLIDVLGPFADFGTDDEFWEELRKPEACDFMFGNPHDIAPQAYVDALVRGAQPTGKAHYAYTMDLPEATSAIAAGVRRRVRTRVPSAS